LTPISVKRNPAGVQASLPSTIGSKLLPGMPAEILIATGERTVMDYVIGPLAYALVKGMRER
jgi:HlyD family secretion protein